ncbi:MAG: membrane protein insertase YidC [Spirochaetes bacterium]|nr:membrane protein insertase YidC [Spirochaetota bacterium]
MEKRALLAIVLSLGVWILWFYLFPPQEKTPPVAEKTVETAQTEEGKKTEISVISKMQNSSTKKEEVTINAKYYTAVLSNEDAQCISFVDKVRNIELIVKKSKYMAKGVFDFPVHFSASEFLHAKDQSPVLWKMQKDASSVNFSTIAVIQNNPLEISKQFKYNETGQYFIVTYSITNKGRSEFAFPEGGVIFSPSDFLGPAMDFDNSYNELHSIYYINDSFEKARKGGGFFSTPEDLKRESGVVKWVGVMSRYYLLIMIPQNFAGSGVVYDNREHSGFRTGIVVPEKPLKPGQTITHEFKVYVGPKNKEKLLAVDKSIGDAADVSKWIEPIRDFMMWCLLEINKLVGNLGWSLVIFSIITKIMFLPLTQRSTESMKKMQELNPVIQELREKYKDKPDVLNKKIMEVYKKNKVNPMGGCLPLLLQMPFFFALYSALVNSVDLWQAPFILWIKDLSLPDTIYRIGGFNINILPLVMTGTTYLQQKMSTGETTQQQKMLMLMPLIFIVIFWNMPSGLVLYWTMQNILQIAHQMIINKIGKK